MARAGWLLLGLSALFALLPERPASAAEMASAGRTTAAASASAATGPAYSFAEYRDYRINSFARRRARLAERLADPNLPAAEKKRLEERKAYYDWLAGMPTAVRDRRYRARFERIDANHDGTIDPAERAAWREEQRAYYRRRAAERRAQATAANAGAGQ